MCHGAVGATWCQLVCVLFGKCRKVVPVYDDKL